MQEFFELLTTGPMLDQPLGGWDVLLSLVMASILPIPITLLYIKLHKKHGYHQAFVQSLILISIAVAAVMLVIGNNLARAFGLVGAVAIIRFRTKMKDPEDTTFLFICITLGMACGLQLYMIGLIEAIFMSIIILILGIIDFGKVKSGGKLEVTPNDSELTEQD